MTKRKTDLERFAAWLAERGGEVLVCTNNWELVRFRGDGVTSIIYNSKSERWTFTGRAQEAWEAFQSNDPAFRITAKTVHTARSIGRRKSVITQTILLRDGDACFYCGEPFTGTNPPTKEHLVPLTANGPNHISNLFLAHESCNTAAGHLSAPEKIRLRDRMRRGRGSKLLARAYDRLFGGEGDPSLVDDIAKFLNPDQKTAETEPQQQRAS